MKVHSCAVGEAGGTTPANAGDARVAHSSASGSARNWNVVMMDFREKDTARQATRAELQGAGGATSCDQRWMGCMGISSKARVCAMKPVLQRVRGSSALKTWLRSRPQTGFCTAQPPRKYEAATACDRAFN